jgi:hypothetical protein
MAQRSFQSHETGQSEVKRDGTISARWRKNKVSKEIGLWVSLGPQGSWHQHVQNVQWGGGSRSRLKRASDLMHIWYLWMRTGWEDWNIRAPAHSSVLRNTWPGQRGVVIQHCPLEKSHVLKVCPRSSGSIMLSPWMGVYPWVCLYSRNPGLCA